MKYTIEHGPESDYARIVVDADYDIEEIRIFARSINEHVSHVAVVTDSGRLIEKL